MGSNGNWSDGMKYEMENSSFPMFGDLTTNDGENVIVKGWK